MHQQSLGVALPSIAGASSVAELRKFPQPTWPVIRLFRQPMIQWDSTQIWPNHACNRDDCIDIHICCLSDVIKMKIMITARWVSRLQVLVTHPNIETYFTRVLLTTLSAPVGNPQFESYRGVYPPRWWTQSPFLPLPSPPSHLFPFCPILP